MEELLDSLVNIVIPRILFIFLFFDKVPDGNPHADNPSLKHSVFSPLVLGFIVELKVVGIYPAVVTSPGIKVYSCLENHE